MCKCASGEDDGASVPAPPSDRAVMLTCLGMRPSAGTSKMRGPAARNTEAACSGLTRMRCTWSAVSSGWLTVDEAMRTAEVDPIRNRRLAPGQRVLGHLVLIYITSKGRNVERAVAARDLDA